MKLIISFKKSEYSPLKTDFKKIFTKEYRWDGKQGWYGKAGYVKATQKMETGEAVTFLVEADEKIAAKIEEFCRAYRVDIREVNSFDNVSVVEVKEEKETWGEVNIDRSTNFTLYMINNAEYSAEFKQRWYHLLYEDDKRLNKLLANPEIDIPVDTLFKNVEDMLA